MAGMNVGERNVGPAGRPSVVGAGGRQPAAAGFIGMAEAGGVILEATPTGQFSVSSLYGIGQLVQPLTSPAPTLNGWAHEGNPDLPGWLLAHLGFDVLFIVGYSLLAVIMVWAAAARSQDAAAQTAAGRPGAGGWATCCSAWSWRATRLRSRSRPRRCGAGSAEGQDVPPALAWALHGATMVKWVAVIVAVIWAGYRILNSPAVAQGIGQIVRAVKAQRFSLVILVLLGVIAASRGSDVLEQMPDVERAWLTRAPSLGWVHLAAAVIAQFLVAFLLLYLGRRRVTRAVHKFGQQGENRDQSHLWAWLLAPAVLLAVTWLLGWRHWAQVSWLGAIAIPVVMWGVALASLAFRSRAGQAPARDAEVAGDAEDMIALVHTVGDLLAVAVVAVAGLGLVRAFTAPALVVGGWYAWADGVAVIVGIVGAVAVWAVARPVLTWIAGMLPAELPTVRRRRHQSASPRSAGRRTRTSRRCRPSPPIRTARPCARPSPRPPGRVARPCWRRGRPARPAGLISPAPPPEEPVRRARTRRDRGGR